ncbi:MAG: CBS domain-containing protein [Limnospira sp.]
MAKTVADVMTPNPLVIDPEAPLKDAIALLARERIGGLPVVDRDGKLVGFISETDIIWQESGVTPPAYITILDSVIYLENPARYEKELHKALGQTVGEVMSKGSIVTIAPDRTISEAARLMHQKRVHRLPVLDESKTMIGILTCGDIIRVMATSPEEE